MFAAFVSLRVFTIELMDGQPHPSEKYLRYVTKVSRQAPHVESVTIFHGNNHVFRCERVNTNWVICDEIASAVRVCLHPFTR
jgi:hypothetical protein